MSNLLEEVKKVLDEEYIVEMSKAFTTENPKRSFWVENPAYYNNRYFKLYNSDIISRATKVARISFDHPNYLDHVNKDGKEDWILTLKEKRELLDILKQKDKRGFTKWQRMFMVYNNDNFNIDFDDLISGDISKEDYNKLVIKRDAISLDYPIPDYMKLEKGIKYRKEK